jgi:hypothetical protein
MGGRTDATLILYIYFIHFVQNATEMLNDTKAERCVCDFAVIIGYQ